MTAPARAALLVVAILLLALGAFWGLNERRWAGPLYCFEQLGSVWGIAPVPPGITPECPASSSYRQDIRQGLGRAEQFRLSGWQPKALLGTLTGAGYRPQTDDLLDDDYSAFLFRGSERIQYSAVRQGSETLITVSGPPQKNR
ncbi:hypothetical protein [Deinococcus sp. Marseille-Q6407]|uniref:hypothetical protein n=1 Tax=Deinococcus sp. Marseille-Q6407 TaxID=2969223 RepID=UPI0021C248EC|nr:hypothetical protein [Deinococcus sp. Marseille-Q6407]